MANLSQWCRNAITPCVSTTNDNDIFALCSDSVGVHLIAKLFLLPCLEESHRELDAFEVTPRDGQIAGPSGPHRKDDSVVRVAQFLEKKNLLKDSKILKFRRD